MMTFNKPLMRYLPVLGFLILLGLLFRGLGINPRWLPSALLDKPVPEFTLPLLNQPQASLSNRDFKGHMSLLNVWASWCVACRQEHPTLMRLARKNEVVIYGLNYKDTSRHAKHWLNNLGNPYKKVGVDGDGQTAINWGVYGTPETFLIDKQGIIRYKQIGPITAKLWQEKLLPLIKRYST